MIVFKLEALEVLFEDLIAMVLLFSPLISVGLPSMVTAIDLLSLVSVKVFKQQRSRP